MSRALLNRRLLKVHRILAIVLGAQVGLWLISGLFMTLFPIEMVRGEHLRREAASISLSWEDGMVAPDQILAGNSVPSNSLTLRPLGARLIWEVASPEATILVDARTGERLSPLSEGLAREVALAVYAGRGRIQDTVFFDKPPLEYRRGGSAWRVDFGPEDAASFYVDVSTGEVRAVRTFLWRCFDFMWGLHIMDWSTRENFNSWWLQATAAFSVLFFFSGLALIVLRLAKGRAVSN